MARSDKTTENQLLTHKSHSSEKNGKPKIFLHSPDRNSIVHTLDAISAGPGRQAREFKQTSLFNSNVDEVIPIRL